MNVLAPQFHFSTVTALRVVFSRISYIFLAGGVSFSFFAFAVWLPNFRLIAHMSVQDIAVTRKLELLLNLLGGIETNFTVLTASYTIVIALLFGVNMAMAIYFIRKRRTYFGKSAMFASIGGIGSGIMGIGCAACGSFVLSAILPVVGAAGVIALLPLKGREFGILSMGLLLISISVMARKIIEPVVCKPSFSKP